MITINRNSGFAFQFRNGWTVSLQCAPKHHVGEEPINDNGSIGTYDSRQIFPHQVPVWQSETAHVTTWNNKGQSIELGVLDFKKAADSIWIVGSFNDLGIDSAANILSKALGLSVRYGNQPALGT